MIDISGYTIEQLAEQALQKPSDFGWWGEEEMFVTWGWAGIDKHRDSSLLDVSNFNVISEDLMDRFPDEFKSVSIGHWAVGHCDRLIVRILKNEEHDIVEDNITDAFKAAMDWHHSLSDYHIASESDYSELEYKEILEYIEYNIPGMVNSNWVAEDIYYELVDNMNVYISPDSQIFPTDEEILEAAYNLNLFDEDYKEDWDNFVTTQQLAAINWDQSNAMHTIEERNLPFGMKPSKDWGQ